MARQSTGMKSTGAKKASAPERVDVLIAGGGYVGLSAAVSIADAGTGLTVAVVDPLPPEAIEKDVRASAIAAMMFGRSTDLRVLSSA